MRIARQALAGNDLPPEMVELRFAKATLDERPRIDARRGVALEEDLIARGPVVLSPEEVVEADLVQARRRGVGREMTADPLEVVVGADDHRDRVPPDEPPDAELHLLVSGEIRLLLRRDGVDVPRLGERRQAD